MCGIAGLFGSSLPPAEVQAVLGRMNDLLAHRGPDDAGVWIDPKGGGGLAHRRLSIIDLAGGHEPIPNEDETVWLVWNGELYNHVELRKGLESKGHRFRTKTDAEVALHLFEEVGEPSVTYLRGMFAYAIWDTRTQGLFFARDRLGKKPFVYFKEGQSLAFASEIAALAAVPGFPRRIDEVAFHHYLSLGYVPAPRTMFSGVSKLPPAHAGRFRDGRAETWRYWTAGAELAGHRVPEFADATKKVFSYLHDAVKVRLMSDVPLGICLSGGIDSAVVTGLASLNSRTTLKTFTIGFDDPEYDERAAAKVVAEHFGTEHHEAVVKPDACEALPRLVRLFGEPFADSSALPMDALAKMMREHVKTALAGDGGDELFAGYMRYEGARLAAALDWVPGPLRGAAARSLRWAGVGGGIQQTARRRARFLSALDRDPGARYLEWISLFSEEDRKALAAIDEPPGGNVRELVEPFFDPSLAMDAVARVQAFDLAQYLPGDLLVKVDIASMAHGLEIRAPFLDHSLVDFVTTLPTDYKIKGGERKRLLKEAFQGLLPESVFSRPKQGFGVPVGSWFREELREFVRDTLTDRRARQRGLLRAKPVEAMLDEHAAEVADHGARLWALLCFELWAREFLDPT